MKLLKEFKEFIMRGNIFDMAVGVIMGGAFNKIVTALTQNVIMPLITVITGKVTVSELIFVLGTTEIPYGLFLQAVIDFLLTAASIFLMIKVMNEAARRAKALAGKEEEPEKEQDSDTEPEPSEEVKLLTEIRDLLKNQ